LENEHIFCYVLCLIAATLIGILQVLCGVEVNFWVVNTVNALVSALVTYFFYVRGGE